MTLDEAAADIVAALQMTLHDVQYCTARDQQGAAAESAVTYLQAVGICELLLDAELDAFYDHLTRSGMMRHALLELHATKGGVPNKVRKASNVRGLYGAIAAGEWELATAIAASSSSDHLDRVEYAEDFLVADFIHRHLQGDSVASLHVITHAIDEALAEVDPDPRSDLCRALLDRDEALAAEAFCALINAQQAYLSHMAKASVVGTDPIFLPLSSIYVEGLAWLQLLGREGIHLEGEFPMCPSMARLPRARTFSGPSIPKFAD